MGAKGIGEFVLGFAGARLANAAFLGSVGAQEVGTAFNCEVVLFRKFVDALKADIAPGSNVVVPDDDMDWAGIVGMAVSWRLGGHGITSERVAAESRMDAAPLGGGSAGHQSVQQRVESFQAVDVVAVWHVGVEPAAVD